MRSVLIGLSCAAALGAFAGASAQQLQLPPGAKLTPTPSLPPGVKPPALKAPCKVDPAMRVTLFKVGGHPNGVRLSILITNEGTSGEWKSGREQQKVTHIVHPGNGGRDVQGQFLVMNSAGPGAVLMNNYATPEYTIDRVAMRAGGYIDVNMGYDPDIAIDGNTCNDDANLANNHVRIAGSAVVDFLEGSARQREFGP